MKDVDIHPLATNVEIFVCGDITDFPFLKEKNNSVLINKVTNNSNTVNCYTYIKPIIPNLVGKIDLIKIFINYLKEIGLSFAVVSTHNNYCFIAQHQSVQGISNDARTLFFYKTTYHDNSINNFNYNKLKAITTVGRNQSIYTFIDYFERNPSVGSEMVYGLVWKPTALDAYKYHKTMQLIT